MNILGKEIPRANEEVIKVLINKGILYVGEDNQLHTVDTQKGEIRWIEMKITM